MHLRQFQASRLLSSNQFIATKDESCFSELVSAAQSPSVPKPPEAFFNAAAAAAPSGSRCGARHTDIRTETHHRD